MTIKDHLAAAWQATLEFIVPLIISTLVLMVIGIATFGVLMPVMLAGYTQSLLRLIRERRKPKVGDLFSHMRLFLPLLIFGIIIFIITLIGFAFMFIPGLILSLAITYICLYTLPLMTDQNMGLIEAIQESYDMAKETGFAEHLVITIIFLAISSLGSLVLLGMLFTQPLATLFLLSVFNDKTKDTDFAFSNSKPSPIG